MPWECAACTMINENDAFLACATCGTQRATQKRTLEEEDGAAAKRTCIDLCGSDDDDEVACLGSQGGATPAAPAATAAPAAYAWRPLYCTSLGAASPGNRGAVSIADVAMGRPKFVVISNYMISGGWLARAWPALRDVERVVVFHGEARTARDLQGLFPRAEIHDMTPKKLEFLHAGTGRPFKNDWGCHHSKFFLVGLEDSLRVAVHTANLIPTDWDHKSQGIWMQEFPPKAPAAAGACDFEDALCRYVDTLQVHAGGAARNWRGFGRAFDDTPAMDLAAALRRFDFSGARGRLVTSAPGYHMGADLRAFGMNRVAQVLAEAPARGREGDEIICNFSSFSKPSQKLLDSLGDSFAADRAPRAPLRLVWPTSDEVRRSSEGYAAGGCMPSYAKNVDLAPRAALRKWVSGAGDDYVRARRTAMPHVKTWSRISADGADVRWSFLTSSNLSGGAHGARQKNDSQLFVMHWEMGILYVGDAKTTASAAAGDVVVPLHFACPPAPYAAGDLPFKWDVDFETPDRFGRHGTH